jgi:hypothetical protein
MLRSQWSARRVLQRLGRDSIDLLMTSAEFRTLYPAVHKLLNLAKLIDTMIDIRALLRASCAGHLPPLKQTTIVDEYSLEYVGLTLINEQCMAWGILSEPQIGYEHACEIR